MLTAPRTALESGMAPPSGISFRTIGLLIAGAMALVFIAIIGVSMMLTAGPNPTAPDPFPMNPDEIIDIEDTQSGGAMLVTIVDQNDPTRIASTLRADRFEPIGDGRRRLDQPESWIYLEDGRAIRIDADFATMLMPDPNQAPESGTLEGNIVIRAYDSTPAPGTPAPDDQPPTLIARFDEPVEFERRYLRMRSAGRFEIESAQVDFSGSDLTVILNDLRNRIERIDVEQGERMVIHTDAVRQRERTDGAEPTPNDQTDSSQIASDQTGSDQASPAQTAAPQDDAAPTATTAQNTPAAADQPPPDIQRYIVTLDRAVEATLAGSGRVNADTLRLWAAFTDGQLPDDAIRRIAFAQPQSVPESEPQSEPQSGPESGTDLGSAPGPGSDPDADNPATSVQAAEPTATATDASAPNPSTDNELVIVWSGPMRVRPIDDEIPAQLVEDHLALQLDSDEGSGITLADPGRGFSGQGKQLTYFATRAVAEMFGEETEAGVLRMRAEAGGELYATRLRADLISGRVTMTQRGSITTAPNDPEQAASVRWTQNARIDFAINDRGELTQRLAGARFQGAAMAEQQGNSIGARVLDATLDPTRPPVEALTNLRLTEGVIASAERSMLSGKDLSIDFASSGTPGEPPYPVRVSSVGSALGRTPDSMLRAQEMRAQLFRDASGQTKLRSAQAIGGVQYRDSKRTTAEAERLDADAVDEIITLSGTGSRVTQAGSSIAGEHITLQAQRRAVIVRGPGTFDHDIALADDEDAMPGQLGHINARWSESMRFEDTLGTIECVGDVRVISTPDALTRDTLIADRMSINLTPLPTSDRVVGGENPQRAFISARASGRARPGESPEPASVESRTYAPDDPELATGVLYLEGAQILADNQQQTLRVPGSGTLLILDREEDQQPDQQEDRQGDRTDRSLDGSGLTRFTWRDNMLLQRAQGLGTFSGSVRVDHRSLRSRNIATLTTDTLVARFDAAPTPGDAPPDPRLADSGITLRSATATGNVRFLFQGRELLCDEGVYDALADSLFARSLDNNRVTLYDSSQPAPVSARTMRWDLGRDRVEINAPSPVRTTPGGG